MGIGAHQAAVFPVTLWQKFLLDQAAHPDCLDDLRDRWALSYAFLVRPGLDMRRLRRAVNKLRQRHDSLRMRFDVAGSSWHARIAPAGENIIREIDLGDIEDDTFITEISAIANAPMPLVDAPLAEFIAVKCGARGDVLILRVHHAIADGHGLVILFEDLIKMLMGIPIFGKAISHAEYIARFESPLPSQKGQIDAFWQKMHKDFPIAPNIGRKAKGMKPMLNGIGKMEQRHLVYQATASSMKAYEDRAAHERISASTLLSAAYLEAMCRCYDLDKLMFMTHVARTDPKLDTYMGDHKLDPVLPYRPGGEKGFADAAKTLGETLIRAIAHLPSEAARRGTAYHNALHARGCFPNQFSVYQPRVITRQNRSAFRDYFYAGFGEETRIGPYSFTPLEVPKLRERRSFDMQFDFGAAKTRTGFTLHYDGISYDQEEVRRIGDTLCGILDIEPTDVLAT